MKKIFLSFILLIAGLLPTYSANAAVFDFEFVTQGTSSDFSKRVFDLALSNNRNIAWQEKIIDFSGSADRQTIFLRTGGTTTTIRDIVSTSSRFFNLRVNDLGEVYWTERNVSDGNLALKRYSGGVVSTIATGNRSSGPGGFQINNNGKVAYTLPTVASPTTGRNIFLFDGTSSTPLGSDLLQQAPARLTDSDILYYFTRTLDQTTLSKHESGVTTPLGDLGDTFRFGDFNDSGQGVWNAVVGGDEDILGFDGTTAGALTINNRFREFGPQINNAGQVVWRKFDRNGSPVGEIVFFDGNGLQFFRRPGAQLLFQTHLTERGELIWSEFDGNDNELFYYDGNVIKQVTDNSTIDSLDEVNDFGDILTLREDGWYLGKNTNKLPLAAQAERFPFTTEQVPEPTTLALIGMGLAGAGFLRRRPK